MIRTHTEWHLPADYDATRIYGRRHVLRWDYARGTVTVRGIYDSPVSDDTINLILPSDTRGHHIDAMSNDAEIQRAMRIAYIAGKPGWREVTSIYLAIDRIVAEEQR